MALALTMEWLHSLWMALLILPRTLVLRTLAALAHWVWLVLLLAVEVLLPAHLPTMLVCYVALLNFTDIVALPCLTTCHVLPRPLPNAYANSVAPNHLRMPRSLMDCISWFNV